MLRLLRREFACLCVSIGIVLAIRAIDARDMGKLVDYGGDSVLFVALLA